MHPNDERDNHENDIRNVIRDLNLRKVAGLGIIALAVIVFIFGALMGAFPEASKRPTAPEPSRYKETRSSVSVPRPTATRRPTNTPDPLAATHRAIEYSMRAKGYDAPTATDREQMCRNIRKLSRDPDFNAGPQSPTVEAQLGSLNIIGAAITAINASNRVDRLLQKIENLGPYHEAYWYTMSEVTNEGYRTRGYCE